uniref:Uncharacterized protein n=1 Tax=Leersia perrieri TaxID=77586 RepID=A0A0D9X5R7_9ORYZ
MGVIQPIDKRMVSQVEISGRSITEVSEPVKDALLNDDDLTRKGKEIFVINGDTSTEDRQLATDFFNGYADAKVLSGTSRIVILDDHLNQSIMHQAIGSVFRPGQKKKVFVYSLVAADSPEEKAHENAFRKSCQSYGSSGDGAAPLKITN